MDGTRYSPLRTSASHALFSVFTWYGALGTGVAILATFNFAYTLVHFDLSVAVSTIIATYKAIFHGSILWLIKPLHIRIPPPAIDTLTVYFLIGGAVARGNLFPRHTDEDRSVIFLLVFLIHHAMYPAILVARLVKLVFERYGPLGPPNPSHLLNRLARSSPSVWYAPERNLYNLSPNWLRSIIDVFFWPIELANWFKYPMVYERQIEGWQDSPPRSVRFLGPSGSFASHSLLFDRRIVLAFQLLAVTLGVLSIVIVNGFLTVPTVPAFEASTKERPNRLLVTDAQQQDAASRPVLRAGQRRR